MSRRAPRLPQTCSDDAIRWRVASFIVTPLGGRKLGENHAISYSLPFCFFLAIVMSEFDAVVAIIYSLNTLYDESLVSMDLETE